MSEHDEQVAVCQWLSMQHPEVLYWANPNGAQLAGNVARRAAQMNKLKAEGFLPGVADITIAEPRGQWHGCFVEMKRAKGGALSENQEWFLAQVEQRGYYTIVAHGFDQAVELIEMYLAM